MSDITDLARGTINGADELSVQLLKPDSMPPVVRIVWPVAPTITTPATYTAVAAAAMRLLATASTELAAIKAKRRGAL